MRQLQLSLMLTLAVGLCCAVQTAAPVGVTQAPLSQPGGAVLPGTPPGAKPDATPREAARQDPPPQPQMAAPPVAPPVVPLLIGYEYVPHYFLQALGDDPHYARVEAAVYEAKPPVYNLVLVEKNGRRVNYSNSEEKVAALRRAGSEARLVHIDHRFVNKFGQLPAHEFGFKDERGQAVRWQFTLAAPASERGAGMSPQEGGTGWQLVYRAAGSAAGEGTAVQVGSRLNEAEPWGEISAPPYFVAYRGVYAEGLSFGMFPAGNESWRVGSAPEKLQEGAQWTLVGQGGRTRQLRITSLRGDEVTVEETAGPAPFAGSLSIRARRTAQGFALRSVTLGSGGGSMRISFAPELDMASSTTCSFQIDLKDQSKILHGSVSVESRGGTAQLRWQPKAPDWARSRLISGTVSVEADGYKVEVR